MTTADQAARPVPRDESVDQWLERTIAAHGPMPESKAERLRRIIAADSTPEVGMTDDGRPYACDTATCGRISAHCYGARGCTAPAADQAGEFTAAA